MAAQKSKLQIRMPIFAWSAWQAEPGRYRPGQEYSGSGLDIGRYLILVEALQRINARPRQVGMGVSMIGPTLLEYGNEGQK